MSDQRFSRLEARLERFIEGAFTQLFSKSIRAQDIALHLSRAMEDNLDSGSDHDPRPIAPDTYTIRMESSVQAHLLTRQPALANILTQHMVELAAHADYRLENTPIIQILADESLLPSELHVEARHSGGRRNVTAAMEPIDPPDKTPAPRNPQLIINGERTILLTLPVMNIGRSKDNHIVISDPYVSRHHAQLRLRFGTYTLFDTNSQGGTSVNEVPVREHRLQSNDVIRIGRTQLMYVEDTPASESQTGGHRLHDAE